MSIKGKLKDFKHRLTDRHMYTIVSLVLIGVLLWGVYQNRRATDYKNQLNSQYNRMFFDLTDNVNNVESLLAKSLMSASSVKTSETLQEAWAQSNMAQMNIIQ
ncbi:MAG TPA: germination protein YpeB, partial [Clostridiales bacterium]|nr:germination protein YpeB [Clostridiales bacterium]